MNRAVDPSTIKYPDEMPKIDKETFFFCKWIDKISTKRKKNRRLFIITDWEFFVLKKKTFSKKLILSYSFRWYDITSIENDDERSEEFTIHFRYDKNKKKKAQTIQAIQNKYSKIRTYFTFKYPKAEKMLKMFYTYLNSFHMPVDLPKFDYPRGFPFPYANGSIPDHVRMKLRLNNYRIPTSTLDNLKKFILSEPTEFCFTEIRGIVSHLPTFLECIYLAPSITTLIVPFDVNFDSLKILNDFLPENRTITSLSFKDKLPDDFSEFKNIFLSEESTRMINSLKFTNSKFAIQNINELSKIIRNRVIRTLCLKNSLGPLTIKPFHQKVYDNPGFQNITTLTLDHTPPIEIRTLLPCLKNVDSLTLIHCEFEIADLFDVITPDYQMNFLNISQNKNDKQIFYSISFPTYLSSIVIRDIEWELLSLNNFIDSLMKHAPKSIVKDGVKKGENEVKIDLSQLRMPDDYWERFFGGLEEKSRGSVVSLHWNGNPIDERFVSFINSFLNLKDLSLNGCFFNNKKDLTSLLSFISKSDTLESLSFTGTELKNMGITALNIIDTLYVNRSIKRIDVSNHKAGNQLLVKLIDVLIDNRVIEEVKFSRNSINDPGLFEMLFLEMAVNRGKPLFTEFPSSFLKSALQFGAVKRADIERMKGEYDKMLIGNQKVKIPQTAVTRKQGNVFKMMNYGENDAQTDYDDAARNRRINREKRHKKLNKKVPLPPPSSANEDEENDAEIADADAGNGNFDDDYDDDDAVVPAFIVDAFQMGGDYESSSVKKPAPKKKKKSGKNSNANDEEAPVENNENDGLIQKDEVPVHADSGSFAHVDGGEGEAAATPKKKADAHDDRPLDLHDSGNDELSGNLARDEEIDVAMPSPVELETAHITKKADKPKGDLVLDEEIDVDMPSPADLETAHTTKKADKPKGDLARDEEIDVDMPSPVELETAHTTKKAGKHDESSGNLARDEEADADMPSPADLDASRATKKADGSGSTRGSGSDDYDDHPHESDADKDDDDHLTFNPDLPNDFDQNDEDDDGKGSPVLDDSLSNEDPKMKSYDLLMNPDILSQLSEMD